MKEPKLWQRAQNDTWYVTINGKQKSLGKDEDEARKKYHALLAEQSPDLDDSVYRLLNHYLAWVKLHRAKTTFDYRRSHLRRFAKYIGKTRKVSELKPYHVQRFVDAEYRGLSSTYINDCISAIKAALNWGVEQGYIYENPIEKMKKPPRRVRQEFLKAVDWPRVLEAAGDQEIKDYLILGFGSGARPQELRRIEARHFDREKRRIVFAREESKGGKRSRVIYLNDETFEVVDRLCKKWPEGPILRNSDGNPWKKDAISGRFKRLRAKLGIPKLTATVLRHSFAYHQLTNGQDSLTASKLMGHVDTRMIATRYGHLDAADEFLQRAANSVSLPFRPAPADEGTPRSESA